jgi:hypothetical protein
MRQIYRTIHRDGVSAFQTRAELPGFGDRDGRSFDDFETAVAWILDGHPEYSLTVKMSPWLNRDVKGGETMTCHDDVPRPAGQRVVRLYAEGTEFTTGGKPARARSQWQSAWERFGELCSQVPVTYGALSIEFELESPAELLEDPGSVAFRDFFLSSTDYSPAFLSRVVAACRGASITGIGTGLLVRTTNLVASQALFSRGDMSSEIARLITRSALKPSS